MAHAELERHASEPLTCPHGCTSLTRPSPTKGRHDLSVTVVIGLAEDGSLYQISHTEEPYTPT